MLVSNSEKQIEEKKKIAKKKGEQFVAEEPSDQSLLGPDDLREGKLPRMKEYNTRAETIKAMKWAIYTGGPILAGFRVKSVIN